MPLAPTSSQNEFPLLRRYRYRASCHRRFAHGSRRHSVFNGGTSGTARCDGGIQGRRALLGSCTGDIGPWNRNVHVGRTDTAILADRKEHAKSATEGIAMTFEHKIVVGLSNFAGRNWTSS